MPQMNNAQKMELVMDIYRAVFAARSENLLSDLTNLAITNLTRWDTWVINIKSRVFNDSTTNQQTIPGFDIILDVGEVNLDSTLKPLKLRFIAQNPNKLDQYGNLKENAILARAGHKIMWVINQDIDNGFLGKVMDDQWHPSTQRAVYPANPGTNYPNPRQGVDQVGQAYNMNQGDWVSQLPDVNRNEVPEHIIKTLGDDECEFIIE